MTVLFVSFPQLSVSGALCSAHLHLQHLVENGLGQAFTNMSLMGSLDQLVSVLFVWNNTPTPGDLTTTNTSDTAVFSQQCFQT